MWSWLDFELAGLITCYGLRRQLGSASSRVIDGVGHQTPLLLPTCITKNLVQFLQGLAAGLWNQHRRPDAR